MDNFNFHSLRDAYIADYLQALDCPRALTAFLLYEQGEHLQLANLEFDPHHYNDAQTAGDSLAATKFLSKAKFLKTNLDLKKIAMDKFFEAEAQCKDTNLRFMRCQVKNPDTCAALLGAAHKISQILGPCPSIDEFVDNAGWGPGATTLLRRFQATHQQKFDVERQITADAYDLVKDWFHLVYPLWDIVFEIQNSSRVVTVPKNSKTDRTIAIEPGINLWFQKSVGKSIRRRLRREGLDLNSQVHNQDRARLGSKFSKLATVDFSSASDTISFEVVRELLPRDWFALLSALRSSTCLVSGNTIKLHKFSSMGNGFTFELETLIFYSLAMALCQNLGVDTSGISVFGDDVILPTEVVDIYAAICADCGFTVNRTKSFSTSYYRESCGKHFWNGKDIQPIFQKEDFEGLYEILRSANSLRAFTYRRANQCGCDIGLYPAWSRLARFLGEKFPRSPISVGDIGLTENLSEAIRLGLANKEFQDRFAWEGWTIRTFVPLIVNNSIYSKGLLLQKLWDLRQKPDFITVLLGGYRLGTTASNNNVPMPGKVRYVRKRIYLPEWQDVGPWLKP